MFTKAISHRLEGLVRAQFHILQDRMFPIERKEMKLRKWPHAWCAISLAAAAAAPAGAATLTFDGIAPGTILFAGDGVIQHRTGTRAFGCGVRSAAAGDADVQRGVRHRSIPKRKRGGARGVRKYPIRSRNTPSARYSRCWQVSRLAERVSPRSRPSRPQVSGMGPLRSRSRGRLRFGIGPPPSFDNLAS